MSEAKKEEQSWPRYNSGNDAVNYYYPAPFPYEHNQWSSDAFQPDAAPYACDVFAQNSSFSFNAFIGDPFWSAKGRLGTLYARDYQHYDYNDVKHVETGMSALSLEQPEAKSEAKKSASWAAIASTPPQKTAQKSLKAKIVTTTTTQAREPTIDKWEPKKQNDVYNPREFDLNPRVVRFFIIKSYSEDDVHRSIKYAIWCSTEHGNKRLDTAWKQMDAKGPIYLLFSVNGSGHFCGMAQMMSSVDYNASSSVWAQDKWRGQFRVKWIYVKDVPNAQLRHIRLENNDNKPVTNSRDTQEVPAEKGKMVLKIMHHYRHSTSIFDDYSWYEARENEKKVEVEPKQKWK